MILCVLGQVRTKQKLYPVLNRIDILIASLDHGGVRTVRIAANAAFTPNPPCRGCTGCTAFAGLDGWLEPPRLQGSDVIHLQGDAFVRGG